MDPIEIIKGIKEIIGGGDFTVTSDRITTNQHECDSEKCPWQEKIHKWKVASSYNWPFTGWLASEFYLVAAFEYNGCDVKNGRILLSSDSWIGVLADGRSYEATAKASGSGIPGLSGCEECCEKSTYVKFDVQYESSSSLGSTSGGSFIVTMCGDGNIDVNKV